MSNNSCRIWMVILILGNVFLSVSLVIFYFRSSDVNTSELNVNQIPKQTRDILDNFILSKGENIRGGRCQILTAEVIYDQIWLDSLGTNLNLELEGNNRKILIESIVFGEDQFNEQLKNQINKIENYMNGCRSNRIMYDQVFSHFYSAVKSSDYLFFHKDNPGFLFLANNTYTEFK